MKPYRNYLYTKGRDLWRLLPAGYNKLLIEERERTNREAYFSCIELSSGKILFEDFQPGEKIWSGIEEIYDEIIYFHKYAKPDMPTHIGIVAYDINKGKIIWENNEYTFSFIADNKVYCFKTLFDGRKYYEVDSLTGHVLKELGEDYELINSLSRKKQVDPVINDYSFPETHIEGNDPAVDQLVSLARKDRVVAGRTDILKKFELLFISFHTVNDNGTLTNHFICVDIFNKMIILEIVLNKELKAYIPDSFFMVNDLLLLLLDKEKLLVYLITE